MDKSRQENVPEIDNAAAGTGRSYECSFCKRGFTNAQALGGHMNIHRKEKAKASKQPHIFHNRSFSNPFFLTTHHQDSSKCFGGNYNHHFHFPLPNPTHSSYAAAYQTHSNSVVATSNTLGSNLSLDMGSWWSTKDDQLNKDTNTRDEEMEHQLDLELRLGHHRKN